MSLEHAVRALQGGRQEQQLLLNLGRELSEFHDLAQAWTADMSDFGQFPVVANGAVRYQALELDRKCQCVTLRGGKQINDLLDGLVGLVIGKLQFAVWPVGGIGLMVEAAVGQRTTQTLVEKQEE
jgi:hypothetical protein